MKLEAKEAQLRKSLSPKRFRHCQGVAGLAGRLARIHGLEPERARTAGLLHDAAKELPLEKRRAVLAKECPRDLAELEAYPALWHAHAGAVHIRLEREGDHIRLTVADDGVGFDLSRLGEAGSTPGLGLITMRERVELAGGRFRLRTRPGDGTEITVALPCLPQTTASQEPTK